MKKLPLFLLLALLSGGVMLTGCSSDEDDDGNNSDGTSVVSTDARIILGFLGRYNTGVFDGSASEIPAFDPATDRLFVVNASEQTIDILNLSDPENPSLILQIDVSPYGGGANPGGSPNSVAVYNGVVAIAVESDVKQNPGEVVFFSTSDNAFTTPLNTVAVGALPDMLTFSPNGAWVLVANEGEPNDDYTVDPEGSVSVIDISAGVVGATVITASFNGFDNQKAELIAAGIRIFGPESTIDEPDDIATVSQDLEPEYITVSADSATAWVSLQENNAMAIIDVSSGTVTDIVPLGFKDHALIENQLDPTNADDAAVFMNGAVLGMYLPDAIYAYQVNGATYIISANEGDARDYGGTPGYAEEDRIGDVTLDPTAFPNAATFQQDTQFGRLKITLANGDMDNDGDFDQLYSYGARSFSIWNANARLVWDSGDQLEKITAAVLPLQFNANNDENGIDSRSDDKGPEPEAVTVGQLGGEYYAFIGLERVGGIAVYNVSNPTAPVFQQYINLRDFDESPDDAPNAGEPVPGLDLGPEGIVFIDAIDSPNGKPLLIVANEVSGSTTIYTVSELFE